jgi:hypothetical protein
MSARNLRVLVRVMAIWAGVGAFAMALLLANVALALARLNGTPPPSILVMPVLLATASAVGLFGAWRLWQLRQDGRLACIAAEVALIVGMTPAAILRGESFVLALVTLSLAVVFGLFASPVKRLCSASVAR